MDSGLAVPVFTQRDDPTSCLNKAMAFLVPVASSRFPLTNNQLRTSSNPRNHVTIKDGKVTMQQIQGRQGQSYDGTGYKGNATSSEGNNAGGQERVVKCYNCQGERHMARQCTQPKRHRNTACADNRPPMLEKSMYDTWKSRMELYMENRENERMIFDSVHNGPLVWPNIVEENGTTRIKKYEELSVTETLQADCDLKVTNIVLQGLAVPVFTQEDDLIACLNKAMAFLSAATTSRVTVQQVKGRQGQSYAGTGYNGNATSSGGNNERGQARVVKCYNCQGEGHMAWQCTQPKRPRNATWFKDKAMLAEAQESSQILDEEQLAFLVKY
uniref:CCHC-type domain-containing protein n=1 Tax=Tanacetum cinerariifolium TaxID=118510 RepID=A0A6L2LT91_TANCI|nr:hypothetical protein [Tanacetum cinerariifolium]